MDRGAYHTRKRELRNQKIAGWIGMVVGLATSWLVVGLFVMYKCMKMLDRVSDEREELEREYGGYQNEQQATA